MRYFLPLLISDSIKDIESAVYLELSLSLIGGIPLDLFFGFGEWACKPIFQTLLRPNMVLEFPFGLEILGQLRWKKKKRRREEEK